MWCTLLLSLIQYKTGPKALNILRPHYGGAPHRRRNNFLFNGYLAIKKSGNFVARLQQNKLLFCERRRRERKFPIFKFSIAAVRRQFTHISEVGGPQMPGAQGQCLVCLVDDPSLLWSINGSHCDVNVRTYVATSAGSTILLW